MRKVGMIILLCVNIIICLSGCNGSHEIDDLAYPYIIGVDRGVSDIWRFTFLFPTLKSSTSNMGGLQVHGGGDTSIVSVNCPTFYSGANMVNSSLSRTLNFVHAKYLIISQDVAKEGTENLINGMIRNPQIRRILHVIIVKDSASQFIRRFKPIMGTSISKTQELMMEQQDKIGFFDDVNYSQFSSSIKSTYTQATAPFAAINDLSNFKTPSDSQEGFKSPGEYYAGELPRSGGNKFEFMGTAIFDGDKMVGGLNGDETRSMLMIKGKYKGGYIVIPDPSDSKLRVTAYVSPQKNPKIKVNIINGKPVINVKIFLEANLQDLQNSINYENPELKPVLEASFKKIIKKQLNNTIHKCMSLNCEVFNFGESAAVKFSTIKEFEAYNWKSHFKDAKVTTDVEFIIRRTGTIIKTSETIGTEGKKK